MAVIPLHRCGKQSDVKSRIATSELKRVDVAAPMEEDGGVKSRVVTRELKVVDVAEPMEEDRDVK